MNKNLVALLVAVMFTCLYSEAQFKPRTYSIRFEQPIDGKSSVRTPVNLPAKIKRANSKAGTFKIFYDPDFAVPDSMKSSIEMAAKIWTARIQNNQPLIIMAKWGECDEEVAFVTEVQYQIKGQLAEPLALLSHKDDELYAQGGVYDVTMTFNSRHKWNCSFDAGCRSEGLNVLTQSLRAIATGLGFGTSVFIREGNFMLDFMSQHPTVFDSHIWSNGIRLSTVSPGSSLNQFMRSKDMSFVGDRNTYKVYAPGRFIQSKTVVFLENTDCLMHHDWGPEVKWMDIDDVTIEILNSIGWELTSEDFLEIVCDELGESGIGSAYDSHVFRIETNGKSITSPGWSFTLTRKDGKEEVIKSGNGMEFEIPAIQNPDKYRINVNGDLEGTVEFKCSYEGGPLAAKPYRVSLGVKPAILSIANMTRVAVEGSPYNYWLGFDINYRGADEVCVAVEEENNPALVTTDIYEPLFARVRNLGICRIFNSWVYITAFNQYGSTTYTIELPAESPYQIKSSGVESAGFDENASYSVYSIQGTRIVDGISREEVLSRIPDGIYVLETRESNGNIKREKIYVR